MLTDSNLADMNLVLTMYDKGTKVEHKPYFNVAYLTYQKVVSQGASGSVILIEFSLPKPSIMLLRPKLCQLVDLFWGHRESYCP